MSALQEMMNYTFVSKYARWLEDKKRRETWREAVDRVRSMMLEKYNDKGIDDEINWAYDMMLQKKVLGSQRALQYGGEPAFKKNARIYNCCYSHIDRLRFFQEAFFLLLAGAGTGFSVQKHHINKLPQLQKQEDLIKDAKTFSVPDTIEGWADAVGILLTTYFSEAADEKFVDWTDKHVKFSFRKIRPKGSPLSSGVGKAPGPDGLKNALNKVRAVLEKCIQNRQNRLKPIDAYDIVMHISDAVLSGGVRRSATICLFSLTDEEMMGAKTGNWLKENSQRARSNNSVVLLRSEVSFQQFKEIINNTKQFGEPGFCWVDDMECGGNPCMEIGFWPYKIVDSNKYEEYKKTYDKMGIKHKPENVGLKSGWQMCNLSTINASTIKDIDDFKDRCRAASIIGTLQAGFTNFEYLGSTSEDICRKEALLGVSITGIMECDLLLVNRKNLKIGSKIVKDTNKEFAEKINIRQAARTCAVKPEGTASSLLGTSSGVHPHFSKRYLRRMQTNRGEIPYLFFKKTNPQACESSVWSANNTDDVIIFPIEVPDGAKTKNQLPALEMLKVVKSIQKNWVMEGKNKELCVHPQLSHNVSNTITVKEDEWDDVARYIYSNREYFCGVSLIPHSGDKDYPQAPFTSVLMSHEIVREYGNAAIWTSGLIEIALQAFNNDLWKACDFALSNEWKESLNGKAYTPAEFHEIAEKAAKRLYFLKKMTKFAKKYFGGDMRKLTYCLKDVYNWKLYCDLEGSFKKVDYTELIEDEDNTNIQEEIACAGGACLI